MGGMGLMVAGAALGNAYPSYMQGVQQQKDFNNQQADWTMQHQERLAQEAAQATQVNGYLGTNLQTQVFDPLHQTFTVNQPGVPTPAPGGTGAPASTGGTPGSTSAPEGPLPGQAATQVLVPQVAKPGMMSVSPGGLATGQPVPAAAAGAAPASAPAATGLGQAPGQSAAQNTSGAATIQPPQGTTMTPQLSMAEQRLQNLQNGLSMAEQQAAQKYGVGTEGYNRALAMASQQYMPQIQEAQQQFGSMAYHAGLLHNQSIISHAWALASADKVNVNGQVMSGGDAAAAFLRAQKSSDGGSQFSDLASDFDGAKINGTSMLTKDGRQLQKSDVLYNANPNLYDPDKYMEYQSKLGGVGMITSQRADAAQLRYNAVEDRTKEMMAAAHDKNMTTANVSRYVQAAMNERSYGQNEMRLLGIQSREQIANNVIYGKDWAAANGGRKMGTPPTPPTPGGYAEQGQDIRMDGDGNYTLVPRGLGQTPATAPVPAAAIPAPAPAKPAGLGAPAVVPKVATPASAPAPKPVLKKAPQAAPAPAGPQVVNGRATF